MSPEKLLEMFLQKLPENWEPWGHSGRIATGCIRGWEGIGLPVQIDAYDANTIKISPMEYEDWSEDDEFSFRLLGHFGILEDIYGAFQESLRDSIFDLKYELGWKVPVKFLPLEVWVRGNLDNSRTSWLVSHLNQIFRLPVC